MGFDSRDGRGERAILGDVKNFAKPMLSPDGERVVFSDRYAKQAFVVNWDGSGLRRIGAGYAVEVWTDPNGKTWVYLCNQVGAIDSINFKSLRRVPLAGRGRPEVVWDKGEISPDNFQLSADGTHAGGEFPWPHGGVFDLTTKTWRKCADGCWASMAPDNSYLSWVFDGPHRNIYLYPPNGGAGWKVPLNTAELTEGFEVFHPRWSNHVRYLAATGPYKVKLAAVNTIAGGGPEVEAYIGRFSDDYRKIDSWIQVTHNQRGDFHPDVWIADGAKSSIDTNVLASAAPPAQTNDRWPGTADGLVFVWDNAAADNLVPGEPPRPCRVEARGHAKFERFFDMDCTEGSFVSDSGPAVSAGCRASDELTLEAAITPGRVPQSGARIIALATNVNARNFLLSQDRDTLVLELHTRNEKSAHRTVFRLGKLTAGHQHHVVVTVANGKVQCFVDGKEESIETTYPGDFRAWSDASLVFGEDVTGKSNWNGRLEAIAMYDRALSANAAARQFELFASRLVTRKPIESLRLRLKCLETSPIPDPRSIVPYRRALVLNRFQVEKVLQGKFEGSEVVVGQWGILDKEVVPAAQLRVGQTLDLTVEPFDLHPELKSERQIVELDKLDAPWFYAKD
ncbi:MAG TPA: LamG-like jellyroll fold domain-containing protein, partial [Planctomycetaceae bacterium]|nr:LamG-like jellyroll fold domain-containing protein [Planctomycetaceae bacterium]